MTTYCYCILGALAAVALGIVALSHYERKWRRRDAARKYYRDDFRSPYGCEMACKYYSDGKHVMHHYGILPTEIGCPSQAAYLEAAIDSLTIAIERCEAKHRRALNHDASSEETANLNEKLTRLRGDLAKLMFEEATPEERLRVANTFITPAVIMDHEKTLESI